MDPHQNTGKNDSGKKGKNSLNKLPLTREAQDTLPEQPTSLSSFKNDTGRKTANNRTVKESENSPHKLPPTGMAQGSGTPLGPHPVGRKNATILVMGMTGTGKSSFIKLLTGQEDVKIGEGIDPETSDISTYQFSQDGFDVALVDTPGFDDNRAHMSDSKLLGDMAQFLLNSFKTKTVNGLIYFHRITDVRFGGTATRNIRMFSSLCGPEAMTNVVILTTRWDETKRLVAERTETQLIKSHFKEFIDNRAKVLRHDNTEVSARKVISTILAFPPIGGIKIVTELNQGCPLSETEAGRELDSQLAQLKAQNIEEINALREEYKQARLANDKAQQKEIKRMRDELQNKLGKTDKDLAQLAAMTDIQSFAAQSGAIGSHIPFVPDTFARGEALGSPAENDSTPNANSAAMTDVKTFASQAAEVGRNLPLLPSSFRAWMLTHVDHLSTLTKLAETQKPESEGP